MPHIKTIFPHILTFLMSGLLFLTAGCNQHKNQSSINGSELSISQLHKVDTATFAGGCFWCTEAIFQQIHGVDTVISGYIGGTAKNPTYKQVSKGNTGHAEAINIIYNPDVISYDELLEVFFTTHDPTQLNRQGNDIGSQYRSAVFYHNDTQREKTAYYIQRLQEEKIYDTAIVTTLEPYSVFYTAEDYHQNYFNNNPEQAYCQYIILPKVEKLKSIFSSKLK